MRLARSADEQLGRESPWSLGSAGVLVALAAYWMEAILLAFRHSPLLTGQERALSLLAPGQLIWALGVLLALALNAAGRHFEIPPAQVGKLAETLPSLLVSAASAGVACTTLAVMVELANFGHGIDAALASLVGYLGVLVLDCFNWRWARRQRPVPDQR